MEVNSRWYGQWEGRKEREEEGRGWSGIGRKVGTIENGKDVDTKRTKERKIPFILFSRS